MYCIFFYIQIEFQTQYNFNISEIITAGSLGHGTAIPGNFDLDLVLYSRGNDINRMKLLNILCMYRY